MAATFAGPKPSPRSNHGAVVDKKGRILIFGGFTENGYSNEVFLIDPVEERWEKPFISGQAPIARESFSMNRVNHSDDSFVFKLFRSEIQYGYLEDLRMEVCLMIYVF